MPTLGCSLSTGGGNQTNSTSNRFIRGRNSALRYGLYKLAPNYSTRLTLLCGPFSFHHLLQDLGFSDRRALIIILSIHSSVALVGLVLHRAEVPEYYQFAIFIGCFALYSLLSSQLWLAADKLQSAQSALKATKAHEPMLSGESLEITTDRPVTSVLEAVKITPEKRM